jgi:hypothetical protein
MIFIPIGKTRLGPCHNHGAAIGRCGASNGCGRGGTRFKRPCMLSRLGAPHTNEAPRTPEMYQNPLAALQHHIENAERLVAEQTVRVEELAKQGPAATLVIAMQLLDTFQKKPGSKPQSSRRGTEGGSQHRPVSSITASPRQRGLAPNAQALSKLTCGALPNDRPGRHLV